ncbi:MAG TPA: hypothetical protein VMW42_09450, partial [Desulfatiglandales bacterium]|nr:hypothetical protein [Desulfatiglandales bacterium]
MNYFLQGFGVFLGVIAGVAITLITQWINEKRKESQKVKNLKFEFELNIKKINKCLEEITTYRNALNGDALNNYFGYFDLSRFVSVTANDMFWSGLLYKYLDHDTIGKLQVIYSEFSLAWEDILNKQVNQNKMKANDLSAWPRVKSEVVSDVNFWEKK